MIKSKLLSQRLIHLLLMVSIGLLTGCTGSVHPLLTDKEFGEPQDLSGKWEFEVTGSKHQRKRIVLNFEKIESGSYDVYGLAEYISAIPGKRNADYQSPNAWILQVGTIEGQRFAQLSPRDAPAGPLLARGGIPVYVFGKIEILGETINFFRLNDVNSAQLADMAKLQHMSYESSDMVELTIFTMPTAELQKAVIEHSKVLFSRKPLSLHRIDEESNTP